jgi:hypothetical protein
MNKRHREFSVQLLSCGSLVSHLHYGLYAREWWYQPHEATKDTIHWIPIRVEMKTQVELNGRKFTLRVAEGVNSHPVFCCESEGIIGNYENSATQAISLLYQQIFQVSTKIAGTSVLGLDSQQIIDELLIDVKFQPYSIKIDKHNLLVYSIGSSNKNCFLKAGNGYISSFIHKYKNERCIIVQKILEKTCIVEMWKDDIKKNSFEATTPNEVWNKIGILTNINGTKLFGLEHEITQSILQKNQIPTCMPNDWNNQEKMKLLFDYHLRRRTLANIEWYSLFNNWFFQKNNIMEIYIILKKMYPTNYKMSDRELQAWHSMLRAAGCTNITPFTSNISPVS